MLMLDMGIVMHDVSLEICVCICESVCVCVCTSDDTKLQAS